MPQYPIVPRPGGNNNQLEITTATVVKAAPGTLFYISVNTAGSTPGAAYDAATIGGDVAANLICNIPDTANLQLSLEFPCLTGILIVPGTGQVLAVAFS